MQCRCCLDDCYPAELALYRGSTLQRDKERDKLQELQLAQDHEYGYEGARLYGSLVPSTPCWLSNAHITANPPIVRTSWLQSKLGRPL